MSERVLVFTPTWADEIGRLAMRPEVSAAIYAQQTPVEYRIGLHNPYPIGDHRNVLAQYEAIRAEFLAGEWDALLTIEHDNLLPDSQAVQRLLDTPGDVVYAPYMLRHGTHMLSTWQYCGDRNLGESLSLNHDELRRARQNVVHRISGAGFGCTLIRRRVLEALHFREASEHDHNACPDLRFATDCLRIGFIANGRFDVPVLHQDEAGHWLHPFEVRRYNVAKYIANYTMSVLLGGRVVSLMKDAEIELASDEAVDLVRAGYVSGILDRHDGVPHPDPLPTGEGEADHSVPADTSGIYDTLPTGEGETPHPNPIPNGEGEVPSPKLSPKGEGAAAPTRRKRSKTLKG